MTQYRLGLLSENARKTDPVRGVGARRLPACVAARRPRAAGRALALPAVLVLVVGLAGGAAGPPPDGRVLQPQEILDALRKVAGPAAAIQLVDYSRTPVPEGSLEFPRAGLLLPPVERGKRPVFWRGRVQSAAQRSVPVWARAYISLRASAVVARQDLEPGRRIVEAAVELKEVDLALFQETAGRLEDVLGKVPRSRIRSGEPVARRSLQEARDVEQGDTVRVLLTNAAASLSFPGLAESAGSAGQLITVRNRETGKRFRARVSGRGRAEVAEQPGGIRR